MRIVRRLKRDHRLVLGPAADIDAVRERDDRRLALITTSPPSTSA
jgi:hypothetical protein